MKPIFSLAVIALLAMASTPIGAETWIALPSGSWVPSEAEVTPVRSSLKHHMQSLAKQQGISMPAWETFTIQYQGGIDSGDQRIYIHGSCFVPESQDPHRSPIIVLDGGSCFFFAEYDIATSSYKRAIFNGEA